MRQLSVDKLSPVFYLGFDLLRGILKHKATVTVRRVMDCKSHEVKTRGSPQLKPKLPQSEDSAHSAQGQGFDGCLTSQ